MNPNRTFAIVLRLFYLLRGSPARVMALFAWVGIDPFEDDVSDVEVVRTQHHHVGRTIEDWVAQLVELNILRLCGSFSRGAPGINRVNRRLAYSTRRCVVSLERQVGNVIEVFRAESAVRKRARALDCN